MRIRSRLDDNSAGEKGEKVAATGDDIGSIVEQSGGECGRRGGGVTDSALGVADPDDEPSGEESAGEACPLWLSEASGELAETGLLSTSRKSDDKKVGRLSVAVGVGAMTWALG